MVNPEQKKSYVNENMSGNYRMKNCWPESDRDVNTQVIVGPLSVRVQYDAIMQRSLSIVSNLTDHGYYFKLVRSIQLHFEPEIFPIPISDKRDTCDSNQGIFHEPIFRA